MSAITLEEAQARLPEVIEKLAPGEELEITRDRRTVAKLVGGRPARPRRQPGNCQGLMTILADDDEHLKDWEDSMP